MHASVIYQHDSIGARPAAIAHTSHWQPKLLTGPNGSPCQQARSLRFGASLLDLSLLDLSMGPKRRDCRH